MELCRKVAAKVMGWVVHYSHTMQAIAGMVDPVAGGMGIVDFTTPAGCELVKAAIRKRGWILHLDIDPAPALVTASVDTGEYMIVEEGVTEYVATCRCALTASVVMKEATCETK
jgi:hypothetical protein